MNNQFLSHYMQFPDIHIHPLLDMIDILGTIDPKNILDVGCKSGESTSLLNLRFPAANTIGIDSSEDIIRIASDKHRNLNFRYCRSSDPLTDDYGKFDLIVSNSYIHCIERQADIIYSLIDHLSSGGKLAVMIPMADRSKFYRLIHTLAKDERWVNLSEIRCCCNLSPENYYDLLVNRCNEIKMWETLYYYPMNTPDDIIDFYLGCDLHFYLDAMPDEMTHKFISELRHSICDNYIRRPSGKIILKTPYLLFIADKK